MASNRVVVSSSGGPDVLNPLPSEYWEQVEVTTVLLEKSLSSLMGQISKDQQKAVWNVGWLLLPALKLQYCKMLAQEAKIHEYSNLEARVSMLEQEVVSLGQDGWGELDPEDNLEDRVINGTNGVVAPALQVWLIVKRYLEHSQPVVPGDRAQELPTITELTTYTSYTPTELRELGKQSQQRPREPIPAWLLRLRDDGAESLQLSPLEMEKLPP